MVPLSKLENSAYSSFVFLLLLFLLLFSAFIKDKAQPISMFSSKSRPTGKSLDLSILVILFYELLNSHIIIFILDLNN